MVLFVAMKSMSQCLFWFCAFVLYISCCRLCSIEICEKGVSVLVLVYSFFKLLPISTCWCRVSGVQASKILGG